MSECIPLLEDKAMREKLLESLRSGSFRNYAAFYAGCAPQQLYRLAEEAKFLRGETKTRPAFMPESHTEQPLRDEIVGLVEEMEACEAEFCQELVDRARHLALHGNSIKDVLALLSTRFPDWREDNFCAASALTDASPPVAGTLNESPEHILEVLAILKEIGPQIEAAMAAKKEGRFDPDDYPDVFERFSDER